MLLSLVTAGTAAANSTGGGGGLIHTIAVAVNDNTENGDDSSSSSSSSSSLFTSDWMFPLLLSCLAGASTCVGAAVVFCFEPSTIRRSMAFSLSLAASVMITISIVSILPEVMTGILVAVVMIPIEQAATAGTPGTGINNNNDAAAAASATSDKDHDHDYDYDYDYEMTSTTGTTTTTIIHTKLLMERIACFGLGVVAYLLLAKLLVFLPDPENLYLLDNDADADAAGCGDDDDGDGEDYNKRNYDLYLSIDDDENGNVGYDSKEDDALLEEDGDAASNNNNNNRAAPLLVRRRTFINNNSSSSIGGGGDQYNNNNINDQHQHRQQQNNYNDDDGGGGEDLTAFSKERRKRSWRVALMLFASLLIHNFPEGLCVAASAKESPELGITVAIGIFIHNVPEGIAISVPCIAARPDRPWLAFWLASISGLAEPLGAIVALSLLRHTKLDLENILAFVAGVMITVALWELYPEAIKANNEEQQQQNYYHQHQQHRHQQKQQQQQASSSKYAWMQQLPQLVLRKHNRPILWGTIVGAGLMVATELYF